MAFQDFETEQARSQEQRMEAKVGQCRHLVSLLHTRYEMRRYTGTLNFKEIF